MDIIINYEKKGNYDTDLNDILMSLNEDLFKYHNEHRLPKPITIYNTAIEKIIEAYNDLLEYFDFKFDINDSAKWKEINKRHKYLLESVSGYIDSIYNIMKCFFPKSTVKKYVHSSFEWMKNADKKNALSFNNEIKEYKKIITSINNKVKHENGKYYMINCSPCYSANISRRCMGYYILGRDSSGVIEPDCKIHTLWEDKYVGISYNYDLRDILCNVYFISYHASNAIKAIIKDNYGLQIQITNNESKYGNMFYELIKKVNDLDFVFFPNEYDKNMSEIYLKNKQIEFHKPCTKQYFRKIPKFKQYKIEYISNIEDSDTIKLLYY
ncbi:MAG: hypothetical protein E6Z31_11150 [Clostridium perfringens]|nr:hypothetical protein [Clostridium perfringens]